MTPRARPLGVLVVLFASLLPSHLIAGCKSTAPAQGSLAFTVGKEKNSWTRTPLPTRIVVKALSSSGDLQTLASKAWPLDTLDLGHLPANSAVSFSAELDDDRGAAVLRGGTPFVGVSDIAGGELLVFCGRTGEFARPDSGLSAAWTAPRAVLVLGRYAFVGGTDQPGRERDSELYDLLTLSPLPRQTALPRAPGAIASADGQHVLLVDAGGASLLDLLAGGSVELDSTSPEDLVGALDVTGGDGKAYLVGATRGASATSAVLRLDASGALVRFDLVTARKGAAAVWVPMTGLVVLGGEAAAPIELLQPLAASFQPQSGAFPTANSAVALAFRPGELLLLGGSDGSGNPLPTRRVPVICTPNCPSPLEVGAPVVLQGGRALPLSPTLQLAVGPDGSGMTTAYLVSDDGTTVSVAQITPRTARKGAAAVALGDGYVALVGGMDAAGTAVLDVEIFTPP